MRHWAWLALAIGLAGCGDDKSTAKAPGGGGAATGGAEVILKGAGATFPEPLYTKWFKDFKAERPNIQVFYAGGGSGAGVSAFAKETVDFAASDAAMSDKELGAPALKARGALMIPLTAGSVALAYNLPNGPKELKLPRAALTGIFLGKITRWNDPVLAAANPGVALPDLKVAVATRSDKSGTTFVFTSHLAAISPEWKAGPGADKGVNFPVGVGAKGNDGVANHIKTNEGSIGYLEYGFAANNGLSMASVENKSGAFVAPNAKSGQAGLADLKLPENLRAWASDPEGKDAYPIVTLTWLLAYRNYPDAKQAAALREALEYCLTKGQAASEGLGYLPLPEAVAAAARKAVATIGSK